VNGPEGATGASQDLVGLDDLADALGPRGVLRPPEDLTAYERPARGSGGPAAAVVRPASTDEVRTVLRWARARRVRLLPQGANTGLVGASVPLPDGPPVVVLSTERLVHGLDLDAGGATAVVPAGLRLSALNDAAAGHDLWFPIDLAADPSVGGMVATNTGGARMLRHGDVRRRVLGVEAVIADADVTVVDDLSVLRKDNTGIDLSSLFIGSSGTLGVVTRVAVELSRRPAETACMYVIPAGPARAVEVLAVLEERLGPLLSAFEVMSAESVAAAVGHVDGVRAPFGNRADPPTVTVLVEAAGPEGTGAFLLDAVGAAVDSGAATDAVAVPAPDAWGLRHALSEGLRRSGHVLGFDVSVPRPALADFRDRVRARVATELPSAVVADFGHWGDGGMHCNLVFAEAPPTATERAQAREIVFGTAVDDCGGSFSAEHGIGPHNIDWWRRTTPAGNQRVLHALKNLFDPVGILGHPTLVT
jgi:FAD/FMN-containing dehydrogenase